MQGLLNFFVCLFVFWLAKHLWLKLFKVPPVILSKYFNNLMAHFFACLFKNIYFLTVLKFLSELVYTEIAIRDIKCHEYIYNRDEIVTK